MSESEKNEQQTLNRLEEFSKLCKDEIKAYGKLPSVEIKCDFARVRARGVEDR